MYGFQSAKLEDALYYRLGKTDAENFILQCNYDSFDKEWMEPELEEYAYILYVSKSEPAEELEKGFARVAHLLRRHKL